MLTLSVTQRRRFSAQGHALNPVVIIGKAGLTNNVLCELDRGLLSHELIKIKVQVDDRNARESMLEDICQRLNAASIQHIGKTFVIYRPRPEEINQKKSTKKQKREPRRTKRSYQN
ncbi:YhbY family RNA-binding protein [Nitrosomonas aestuarii]|uniref:Putative RNA-binding protein, YhbY family n=1 Tax=Nitrosomonas aestuarii TaxID=52441 RepID=A0A1I4D3S4_9PROT|nr:YhbY family RNA-binding protein [Nitrosomonas aestuarii]PTN09154.1 putative YhbY family RNA-binding protein [Nitrosomonas aestuarii]SFK88228.1 putative RNA-binding protein, YhbY family [Nitrosomonas aestuarii]